MEITKSTDITIRVFEAEEAAQGIAVAIRQTGRSVDLMKLTLVCNSLCKITE